MFKKLIIIIFLSVFLIISCNAQNYELPEQYKTDINKAIEFELPAVEKRTVSKFFVAKILYKDYFSSVQNKEKKDLYIEALEDCLKDIESSQFNFYNELVKITDKYNLSHSNLPDTDNTEVPYSFVMPFLKHNKININALTEFDKNSEEKAKQIEIYIDEIRKN